MGEFAELEGIEIDPKELNEYEQIEKIKEKKRERDEKYIKLLTYIFSPIFTTSFFISIILYLVSIIDKINLFSYVYKFALISVISFGLFIILSMPAVLDEMFLDAERKL